jgi:hypothetical protein
MELEEKGKITEMNKMDTYIGGKEEEEIVILLRYVIFSRETSFPCGDGFKIRKKLLHFLLFFRKITKNKLNVGSCHVDVVTE